MRENWLIYDPVTGTPLFANGGDYAGAFEDAILSVPENLHIVPLPSTGEPLQLAKDKEIIREGVWEAIKRKRERVIDSGATTPAGKVQTDLKSRLNMAGLAVAALIEGADFTETITKMDNTKVTVNKNQMLALALAVKQHVSKAHARSQVLRDAKDNAETIEDLLKLPINEGWPE